MIHHVKGCMVDFAPDIVLLHCVTNDSKKDLTPQEIAQKIFKLAEQDRYHSFDPPLFKGARSEF